MEYKFSEIEEKWKQKWAENDIYKVTEDPNKPKYYVLDMFPYPSGAGLHVGHPLGYVASDIFARYKRLKGFNVLHPMGFDAFGLPAEQYAIETGTHPAVTTEKAIKRYREQYDKIGFNYDWSRSVTTCDPSYYKWTQWIFLKLFGSWYNRDADKAELLPTLIARFETKGCYDWAQYDKHDHAPFTAEDWKAFTHEEKEGILMHYRLAYLSYAEVNWCAALGTVLANDEVKDGKSERGGYPVERKKMRQWFLRITEYSDRLLEGLERIDWSESMKEMQRNWIGRSEGALVDFRVLTPNPSPKERGTAAPPPSEKGAATPFGYMTGKADTGGENILRAKDKRKNPTPAEKKLWAELRNQKLGYKFRRQHLIDRYIVDFVCIAKGIVVEVDGESHNDKEEEDAIRTQVLELNGFKVIRYSNQQVLNQIEFVLADISNELKKVKEERVPLLITENFDKTVSPLLGRGEMSEGQSGEDVLKVFTTRPDTIFGATFLVIAPEHDLVEKLITVDQKAEVEDYLTYVKSRTDVERQQEKRVTGAFTGSYAVNPFTNELIPVWIAEYVLVGYGTGAIMAVPADDERDKKFAEKFGLPIVDIIDKSMHPGATIEDKVGKMINSGFLNGLEVKDAIKEILNEIEDREIGQRKVNYRQRDAGFSRQRYWGEPFPIRYEQPLPNPPQGGGLNASEEEMLPIPLDESLLPLVLPEVNSYKPTGDGKAPLAGNADWVKKGYETDTMPGYAASSWYFLRYMDAQNPDEFAAKDKLDYWQNVDLYVGGTEHAVGHLLYSRMWHKFLHDLGYVQTDEPFKRLVNQGMIQGVSAFTINVGAYGTITTYPGKKNSLATGQLPLICISKNKWIKLQTDRTERGNYLNFYDKILRKNNTKDIPAGIRGVDYDLEFDITTFETNVPINLLSQSDELDQAAYKEWRKLRDGQEVEFYLEDDGTYICPRAVEKMSKSKYNVVNPDDVIEKFGADCFRMFEMFLGPIEQSKPWDDKGISGVYNFLRKFWRMFYSDGGEWKIKDEEPTAAELKVLHKTIKKVSEDIEKLAFNTCVSSFMICLNELGTLNCTKRKVVEPLLITLAPFAPFITEELWAALGNATSIHLASYPVAEEKYLVETAHNYGVSINGKVRAQIELALDLAEDEVKRQVLELENVKKWTNGAEPKKFIFVKGKIINVVV